MNVSLSNVEEDVFEEDKMVHCYQTATATEQLLRTGIILIFSLLVVFASLSQAPLFLGPAVNRAAYDTKEPRQSLLDDVGTSGRT